MDRQPTRSKRVVAARRFDKTQLRRSGHGRTVHRDYGAHVLRWNFVGIEIARQREPETPEINHSPMDPYLTKMFFKWGWVAKRIKQHMKILDVGCGQDQPLLYVLGSRMNTVPDLYVGVDLNNILRKSNVRWSKIYDNFDFVTNGQKLIDMHGPFDVVTNFEVIEHMHPDDGLLMLSRFRDALKDTGLLYLSTPVFDGMAAANHVHEYTIPELKAMIEEVGFKVSERFGTFASKPQVRDAMWKAGDKEMLSCYDRLERWFGGDVMSTFAAALYPDASRNNIWVCRK